MKNFALAIWVNMMQASVTGQFGETEYPATTAVKHQNLTLHRRFKLADL